MSIFLIALLAFTAFVGIIIVKEGVRDWRGKQNTRCPTCNQWLPPGPFKRRRRRK